MPSSWVFTLVAAGLFLVTAVGAAAQGWQTDFEDPFEAVTGAPGKPSRVTGEIGPPFAENSSGWADVDMRFSRLTEEPFAGKAALRCEVTAVREGRAQIWIPGIQPPAGKYGRLRVALRAPSSAHLEIALRQSGPPWRHAWQKSYLLSPEWRVVEEILPPAPAYERGYSLMLYLPVGVVDLDDFSLVFLSADELAGSAPPREGNLLPTSTFAIGLPSPWSLASGYVGSSAAADPSDRGLSGQPCLRVRIGYSNSVMPMSPGAQLVSPAIPVNSLRVHAVSFWAKGTPGQVLQVGLGAPSQGGFSGRVMLTDGWQRHQVAGKLPLLPDGFAVLTIQSSAEFRIDGVQVEEAGRAGDYRPAAPVELALAPPAGKARGIHFAGEPLVVRLGAAGELKPGLRLRGALVHVEGASRPVDVALPAGAAATTLTLPDLGEPRLGTYRLELRIWDGDRPVSPWAEVVLHRVRQPRFWGKDAPGSPFGVHINAVPEEAEAVKRLGFNWVRIHDAAAELTKWYFLEKAPEEWDWSRADAGVDLFRKHRLMILGMLDTAPRFRSHCPEGEHDWFSKYYLPKPEERERWEQYCRAVVARFKGRVGEWEVWNEPYINSFFRVERRDGQLAFGTPADYAPLLRHAFRAVRETDPKARVIWASQPGAWNEGGVTEKAYEVCDEASLHAYIAAQPRAFPDFDARVATLRRALPVGVEPIPLQNTEGGAGGSNLQHFLAHTPPADKLDYTRVMAEYLVRYQVASLAAGVKRFYLYTYHKWYWQPDWNLRLPDGSMAPNATAQANLFWHVEGKRYAGHDELRDGFHAYRFEGGGEAVAVVMKQSADRTALTLPRLSGATVRDLYGNDVAAGAALLDGVWYLTAADRTGLGRALAALGR